MTAGLGREVVMDRKEGMLKMVIDSAYAQPLFSWAAGPCGNMASLPNSYLYIGLHGWTKDQNGGGGGRGGRRKKEEEEEEF